MFQYKIWINFCNDLKAVYFYHLRNKGKGRQT